MGLLDYLDPETMALVKSLNEVSPEQKRAAQNQAAMQAGFAMLANNHGRSKGQAFGNAMGNGGMAGMDAYNGTLANAQREQMGQLTQGLQLSKIAEEQKRKAQIQKFMDSDSNIPAEVRAGVIPYADYWKRQNPEDQYKTVGDSLVKIGSGKPEQVFQNKKLPEGMEMGEDGVPRFMPSYLSGKKEIASSGASRTNVLMDNLGLKPKDRFEMEDKLRGDYNKATDLDQKIIGISSKLRSVLRGDPNAMKDQASIYSFAKMLDPDGAVREADYSAITNTAGLADRIRNYVNKLATGQMLSGTQRKEMEGVLDQFDTVAKRRIKSNQVTYGSRAKMYNLQPENLFEPLKDSAVGWSAQKVGD